MRKCDRARFQTFKGRRRERRRAMNRAGSYVRREKGFDKGVIHELRGGGGESCGSRDNPKRSSSHRRGRAEVPRRHAAEKSIVRNMMRAKHYGERKGDDKQPCIPYWEGGKGATTLVITPTLYQNWSKQLTVPKEGRGKLMSDERHAAGGEIGSCPDAAMGDDSRKERGSKG